MGSDVTSAMKYTDGPVHCVLIFTFLQYMVATTNFNGKTVSFSREI